MNNLINKNNINKIIKTIILHLTIIFISHFLSTIIETDDNILNIEILKKMLYTTLSIIFYYTIIEKML